MAKAERVPPAPEAPAADEGELESDKDKQRKVAASIEHQLTHNPWCAMCEVCLRCKIQRRQKRTKGRVDMGEAPTKFGAQCIGGHLNRQRGLESESDVFMKMRIMCRCFTTIGELIGWIAILQNDRAYR